MTENELKIELECYKMYINKDCDINNLSLEELAEFITLLDVVRKM